MARRAKPHDEELPFVALMDTMTNVVGVLIIVLVMIGIGLAKSVQKVLSDLPLVSVEEHSKLKEELAAFDAKRDPAEVQLEIGKLEEELAKLAERLKALEAKKESNPALIEDLDGLVKQLERARKEQKDKKLLVDQLLARIDELKVKLDKTPRYEAPPPVVVRLPNARPMPENAQIHRILVTENRIVFLRNQELMKLVEEECKKDGTPFVLRRDTVKGPDGKPVMKKGTSGLPVPVRKTIFDAAKMEAYFNNTFNKRKASSRDVNRDVLVQVAQAPNSPSIQVRLAPKPEAGETVAQAALPNSLFRTLMKDIKKDPSAILWFHVCKDSVAAYLGARDIVDGTEQIPVGWEMFDKPLYSQNLSQDFLVDYTPPPPPPGATPGGAPKPPGPPPVVIAAPKATVD